MSLSLMMQTLDFNHLTIRCVSPFFDRFDITYFLYIMYILYSVFCIMQNPQCLYWFG